MLFMSLSVWTMSVITEKMCHTRVKAPPRQDLYELYVKLFSVYLCDSCVCVTVTAVFVVRAV